MKKISIAALFAAAAVLCACGEAAQTVVDTTAVTEHTETTVEETTVDLYADDRAAFDALPTLDLGGAEFMVAAQQATGCSEKEIYVEATDGEVVNDAIFQRNLLVNERFNCEIRVLGCDVNKTVRNAVSAGDASISLATPSLSTAGILARAGFLTNFNDYDVISLDSAWWDTGTADISINGKIFFMNGDINLLDNDCTYLLFFNKKLIADYDMEEPYQLVRDGKWTLDVFSQMCQNISADLNGDGVMNESDRWGYVTTDKGPNTFFYGSDLKYVYFDENSVPVLQPNIEKITSVLDKVVGILGKTHQVSFIPGHHSVGKTIFMEDRSLFYGEVLSYVGGLREMESEFGILPIPKYDEAQSAYYTYCESNSSTATIPNLSGADTAAVILEAMAIQSYINVTPAYYEVAIQRKYSRDEASVEMLDIALENRVYDMARIYSTELGVHEIFQSLATKGSTDFASAYAKKESRGLEKLEKLIAYFNDME